MATLGKIDYISSKNNRKGTNHNGLGKCQHNYTLIEKDCEISMGTTGDVVAIEKKKNSSQYDGDQNFDTLESNPSTNKYDQRINNSNTPERSKMKIISQLTKTTTEVESKHDLSLKSNRNSVSHNRLGKKRKKYASLDVREFPMNLNNFDNPIYEEKKVSQFMKNRDILFSYCEKKNTDNQGVNRINKPQRPAKKKEIPTKKLGVIRRSFLQHIRFISIPLCFEGHESRRKLGTTVYKPVLVAVTSCNSDLYHNQNTTEMRSKLQTRFSNELISFYELAVGMKDAYAAFKQISTDESKKNNVSDSVSRAILSKFMENIDYLLALVEEVAIDTAAGGLRVSEDDVTYKSFKVVIQHCSRILESMLVSREQRYTLIFRLNRCNDKNDITQLKSLNKKIEKVIESIVDSTNMTQLPFCIQNFG
eukprot:CAMPEP_0194179596 /NCGR_PEP_ID=MMETSP0154-20130528/13025_1 /TAXON_ID=1049557 /ORGANISM="Thalassiothrix antarctica, Strain L6-D1" /LENGTH=419 /DNA_ID=CAMNT_0038894999 /DNA_START=400 /DNA_END=1659 /DNA_ORIENTATION=-